MTLSQSCRNCGIFARARLAILSVAFLVLTPTLVWAAVLCGTAGSVYTMGTCSTKGIREFDTTYNMYKVCNGTNWVSMRGNYANTTQGNQGTNSCRSVELAQVQYDTSITNYRYCDGQQWIGFANNGTMSSCTGTTTGTVEFDTTGNYLKWCNGTNWIKVEGLSGGSKCIFATSTTYNGAMGGSPWGTSKADSNCAARATAGGLSGTYKAWLSDGTNTASARLTHATSPYVMVDGTEIAKDWYDLTDATMLLRPRGVWRNGTGVTAERYTSTKLQGNYLYVTTNYALTIWDISIPTAPVKVGYLADYTKLPFLGMPYISGNNLLVKTSSSCCSGNDGWAIINVADPAHPAVIYNTGDINTDPAGLSGNYAYVLDYSANTLKVYNISNPASPTLTGSVTDSRFSGKWGVLISGNYLYMSGGIIVDISNPAAPAITGALSQVGSPPDSDWMNGPVYSLYGNYWVSFGTDPTGVNTYSNFTVTDVSNPAAPVLGYHTNSSGCTWNNWSGEVSGSKAYSAGFTWFSYFDLSNIASPTCATVADDMLWGEDIAISGNYAYLPEPAGMHIYNISTNPPTKVGTVGMFMVADLKVIGNYAYVTTREGDFMVFDISNPDNPVRVAILTDTTWLKNSMKFDISGNYAFIATGSSNGVTSVNISNPLAPTVAGHITHGTNLNGARDIKISGNYAFVVANSSNRITAVNITTPSSMTITSSKVDNTNLPGPNRLAISGNYAYVAAPGGNRVTRVNIGTPSAMTITNSLQDATNLKNTGEIVVSGNYAYVGAMDDNRVTILNISNTAVAPALTGTVQDATYLNRPMSLALVGSTLYVGTADADTGDGKTHSLNHLSIVDVSTPASPAVKASFMPSDNNGAQYYDTDVIENSKYMLMTYTYALFASGSYLYRIGSGDWDNQGGFSSELNIMEMTPTRTTGISKDELGAAASGNVWTGSDWDGSNNNTNSAYCTSSGTAWRSTSSSGNKGVTGVATAINSFWTRNAVNTACNTTARLYCLQQ